ncbi:pyrroline-5-carboxylate reductase [Chromatiales bacterium (ex Bugula neritina AB1)]|nr:pyrroline-5-carboxylate reductase [Chromatiales bacterium (ex Bugula neritina AB1)]
MARSLIGGLVDADMAAGSISVSDPGTGVCEALHSDFGIHHAGSNGELLAGCDLVVMAVKPQQMKTVVSELAGQFQNKLLVSIAAGVLSNDLLAWTKQPDTAIVRCMPNTPALLKCGATGLFANHYVTEQQRQQAESVLAAVGDAAWVDSESQLDAITALSGSGPAYFFLLIESMIDAAQQMNLPKDLATRFAIQTALGAANMAQSSNLEPAQLRENVTSPAGTTEAALNSFSAANLSKIVQHAMQAAEHRAVELGIELGDKANG